MFCFFFSNGSNFLCPLCESEILLEKCFRDRAFTREFREAIIKCKSLNCPWEGRSEDYKVRILSQLGYVVKKVFIINIRFCIIIYFFLTLLEGKETVWKDSSSITFLFVTQFNFRSVTIPYSPHMDYLVQFILYVYIVSQFTILYFISFI